MGGSSCGKSGSVPWGCHGSWFGIVQRWYQVSQLSARTSCCALGGLHPGTNELIGEDLGVVISLDANQ